MSKSNRSAAITKHKEACESYLVALLDSLIVAKDFTYGEFNNVLPFGPDVEALREAEQQYPDLGIARYGTSEEGISTISLLATVSSVFCGKRLGVILQEDDEDIETPLDEKLILGFTLLDEEVLVKGKYCDIDPGAMTDKDAARKDETKETEFTYTRIDDKKEPEIKGTSKTEDAWEVKDVEYQPIHDSRGQRGPVTSWTGKDESEIPDEAA